MGKALIYKQIPLTNSLGKCMEISLENCYLNSGLARARIISEKRPLFTRTV